MDDSEAHEFIKNYFSDLFIKRNIDSLDLFLHQNYWDDDINDNNVNHIESSKKYLENLFKRIPTIDVEVIKSNIDENIITSYLHWTDIHDNQKVIWKKGIAIFVLKDNKIFKRHTYIYYSRD